MLFYIEVYVELTSNVNNKVDIFSINGNSVLFIIQVTLSVNGNAQQCKTF